MQNNIIELINDISNMYGDSLSEKILDYCETNNKDPKEIGDLLEESKDFKKLLYHDCVKNNIIKDEDLETFLNKTEDISIW